MEDRPKAERVNEFLSRLAAARPATTASEAFDLIGELLNRVEDELTAIPYDPEAWMSDGRMYPPQEDSRRIVQGHPEIVRYRSVAHHTLIRSNGAIEIRHGTEWTSAPVVFEKPGADGKTVWQK